jgi:hypothetical protein
VPLGDTPPSIRRLPVSDPDQPSTESPEDSTEPTPEVAAQTTTEDDAPQGYSQQYHYNSYPGGHDA